MFFQFGDGFTAVGGADGDVPAFLQQLDDELAVDVGIIGDQDAEALGGFMFLGMFFGRNCLF